MHLTEIKIINSFVVKTRGKVLVTDLLFTNENLKKVNVGDTVDYEDVKFEIDSIECISKSTENGFVDSIAFFVK